MNDLKTYRAKLSTIGFVEDPNGQWLKRGEVTEALLEIEAASQANVDRLARVKVGVAKLKARCKAAEERVEDLEILVRKALDLVTDIQNPESLEDVDVLVKWAFGACRALDPLQKMLWAAVENRRSREG